MASFWSSLTDNLAKGLHKEKCKDYKSVKVKSCDGDLNKFCLMLLMGAYPYKYMDGLKKLFNEMLLTTKKTFYSHLTMEGITGATYKHAKRV